MKSMLNSSEMNSCHSHDDAVPLILRANKGLETRPLAYISVEDINSCGPNDLETRYLKLHWGLQVNGKLNTHHRNTGHYWNNHHKAFTNFQDLTIEEFDVIYHWITDRGVSSCLLDANNWHNIYKVAVLNGMYSLAEYSLHLCNKRPQGFEYPALDVDNVYDWMVLDNNCFDFYLKAKELTEKGWEI